MSLPAYLYPRTGSKNHGTGATNQRPGVSDFILSANDDALAKTIQKLDVNLSTFAVITK